jgi:phenylacetate-CoA ligase
MVVFRGVNVYPGQVDEVLSRIGGIGSEYQVLLDRKTDGKDYMTVKVELASAAEGGDAASVARVVASEIKRNLMVSCAVDMIPYGTLPRSDRKTKRVFDNRPV